MWPRLRAPRRRRRRRRSRGAARSVCLVHNLWDHCVLLVRESCTSCKEWSVRRAADMRSVFGPRLVCAVLLLVSMAVYGPARLNAVTRKEDQRSHSANSTARRSGRCANMETPATTPTVNTRMAGVLPRRRMDVQLARRHGRLASDTTTDQTPKATAVASVPADAGRPRFQCRLRKQTSSFLRK